MSRLNRDQLLALAKSEVVEMSPQDLKSHLEAGKNFGIVDVRERDEFVQGHLPDATFIPRGYLELQIEQHEPDRSRPLAVYCAGGVRSLLADEMGEAGQVKLLESKVLLIGAGGLGSPAAIYLAAAGVGTLGIVDFDTVDVSNLQRQILHGNDDVGRPKVESAADRLRDINPEVNVIGFQEPLTSFNAMEIISQFDVVLNGSDNFPTRYLVNDACQFLNKPLVDASIFMFEGQVTVYDPQIDHSPCYRCLYPDPPPPGEVPSCAEGGVLGVLPGIVGSLQAIEAIKLLAEFGESLVGRLVMLDTLDMSFRNLKVTKDRSCPVCGEDPTVTELIDYQQFCGLPSMN